MQKNIYTGSDCLISPLGLDSDTNFNGLAEGRSALCQFHPGYGSQPVCASLFDESIVDDAFGRLGNPVLFTRLEKISILAIAGVLKQSVVSLSDSRTLLLYSTAKGNINLLERQGPGKIAPDRVYLPVFAGVLGSYFNCANTPLILSNACISGLLALVIAKRLIGEGRYDHVVVAGGDIVSEFTVSGFRSFNALSDEPCRPYDALRNGINLGEAAAAVVLSRQRSVAADGFISIGGGASANDANHISGPSRTGEGLFRAVEAAKLVAPGVSPGFISAHGTATGFNDEMESIAFTRSGYTAVPVQSLKGYYGHTLGAAGLLESIVGIHSLRKGILIGSAGFSEKGVSGDVEILKNTRSQQVDSFLKTASGFGGCNAAAFFIREGSAE